jgi:hypothetical protein
MINKALFANEISILADKAGRELRGPTIVALYDTMPRDMTDEEFVIGCRRALRRESFFPTPQQIISLSRPTEPSAEVEAGEMFDKIREHSVAWNRDPVARAAVQQAGGEGMVLAEDVRVASFARRDFVKAYAEIKRRAAEAEEIESLLPAARRAVADLTGPRPISDMLRKFESASLPT